MAVVIEIADGVVLTQPLQIVQSPAAMRGGDVTRSLLRPRQGCRRDLGESYVAADGAKAYQVHDSLIISIGNNSRLDHVRLNEDAVTRLTFRQLW